MDQVKERKQGKEDVYGKKKYRKKFRNCNYALKKSLYFEGIIDLEKSLEAKQRGHKPYALCKLPLNLTLTWS